MSTSARQRPKPHGSASFGLRHSWVLATLCDLPRPTLPPLASGSAMSAVCPTSDAFILPVSSEHRSLQDCCAAFTVNPAEAEGNPTANIQFRDLEDVHLIIAIAVYSGVVNYVPP
ncbi:hypothetical protein FRC08_018389 [Ceratobasidium sp. 394]|nr:hypothetical protein FRC08_018389 [Ceratobasidium sp. 394]